MKPIELCFFRHGIAVEKDDPSVTSDAERPLTDEGVRKTQAAAEGLIRLDGGYTKLLTSPWLRAKQTAAILAEVLELPSEELPELAGDQTPEALVKAVARHHARHTLLVGHEPLLSATVVRLLGGEWTLDLKKAGACSIEVDALPPRTPGTLLWHMTARQLRWLGKGS
jgi:phosphohistidine phosphatase